jgi:glucokinase
VADCTIGVDLGGTKLLAGALDAKGTVVARERREIGGLPLDELLAITEEVVSAVAADVGLPGPGRVGFGIPSLIDQRTGVSVRCVHLPLDGVPFGEVMRSRLGVPVVVDNDANCATVAEWQLGAARGCSHVAMLTLGTGIGGGLVLGGRLYRGAVGAAAELGHVPVDLDGPPCFGGCPGRGCLEALCSGSAIARDSGALAGGPYTAERVTELAVSGNREAQGLMRTVGTRLGAGLAGIAMAFNPEMIVVGGGVLGAGELLLAPARAELARRAMRPATEVRVEAASFGGEAGMVGAALLARAEAA